MLREGRQRCLGGGVGDHFAKTMKIALTKLMWTLESQYLDLTIEGAKISQMFFHHFNILGNSF